MTANGSHKGFVCKAPGSTMSILQPLSELPQLNRQPVNRGLRGAAEEFIPSSVTTTVSTPPTKPDKRSEITCSFFARNSCRKGESCPFAHPRTTSSKIGSSGNEMVGIQKVTWITLYMSSFADCNSWGWV